MQSAVTPVRSRAFDDFVARRAIAHGLWHRFRNWLTSARAYNRAVAEVRAQLAARPDSCLEESFGSDVGLARSLGQSLAEAVGWPHTTFIREDSMEVLLMVPFDGMLMVEFASELPQCDLDVDRLMRALASATFGDVVELVKSQPPTA